MPCQSILQHTELQIRCINLTSIDFTCVISWPNPMFDHLLESSGCNDSNKWPNIGFGQEMGNIETEIRTLSGTLNIHRMLDHWPNPVLENCKLNLVATTMVSDRENPDFGIFVSLPKVPKPT